MGYLHHDPDGSNVTRLTFAGAPSGSSIPRGLPMVPDCFRVIPLGRLSTQIYVMNADRQRRTRMSNI